ncbi:MarR family transcriptional regulator [Streptomyces sp. NPDC007095]|jgi:DNA-binding MarR family transcriptional regulator|uniref:MarR family winged helix-turn-helix transcriptional regulator n=1 Tax=Streptomyces sp. NPDC007095 TaxID=3154482 RepID=UPI0034011700
MNNEDFLRLLVRAQIHLWDAADTALRTDHDLPLVSYLPMRVIAQTPDCRVQDIANQLAITSGGASQAVDRIEKAGHVERRPHPANRRSSIVELTAEGRALLDAAAATLDQEMDQRLAPLSTAARRQITDSLAALLTRPR